MSAKCINVNVLLLFLFSDINVPCICLTRFLFNILYFIVDFMVIHLCSIYNPFIVYCQFLSIENFQIKL